MQEDKNVRRLAELKSFLESRAQSLENDLSRTKELIELVDKLLVEKSFRKVEPTKIKTAKSEGKVSTTPLTTVDGLKLADFIVEGHEIKVKPSPELQLEGSSPPLNSFLVNRVLEPMKNKDLEAVRAEEKIEEEAFTYEIPQEGGYLKSIIVKNFGDERRMMELKGAIKWTLRRMYERSVGETNIPPSKGQSSRKQTTT